MAVCKHCGREDDEMCGYLEDRPAEREPHSSHHFVDMENDKLSIAECTSCEGAQIVEGWANVAAALPCPGKPSNT